MSLRVQDAEYLQYAASFTKFEITKSKQRIFFFLFWFTYIYDMILRNKQASERRESKVWKGGDFWGILGAEMKEWSTIHRGVSRSQGCSAGKVGDGVMSVYPTLHSFIATLLMLSD